MTSLDRSIVQFSLPFDGLIDRVRNAAEAGKVLMLPTAQVAMSRDDISDVIIIRALRRCETLLRARKGEARGEWRCVISFNPKGFRAGGIIALIIVEGRIFVEDIYWDRQP